MHLAESKKRPDFDLRASKFCAAYFGPAERVAGDYLHAARVRMLRFKSFTTNVRASAGPLLGRKGASDVSRVNGNKGSVNNLFELHIIFIVRPLYLN
jgi:hypothetical protein